jgi:hypothetical protein
VKGAPYEDKFLLERFIPIQFVDMTIGDGDDTQPILKLKVFGWTYSYLYHAFYLSLSLSLLLFFSSPAMCLTGGDCWRHRIGPATHGLLT